MAHTDDVSSPQEAQAVQDVTVTRWEFSTNSFSHTVNLVRVYAEWTIPSLGLPRDPWALAIMGALDHDPIGIFSTVMAGAFSAPGNFVENFDSFLFSVCDPEGLTGGFYPSGITNLAGHTLRLQPWTWLNFPTQINKGHVLESTIPEIPSYPGDSQEHPVNVSVTRDCNSITVTGPTVGTLTAGRREWNVELQSYEPTNVTLSWYITRSTDPTFATYTTISGPDNGQNTTTFGASPETTYYIRVHNGNWGLMYDYCSGGYINSPPEPEIITVNPVTPHYSYDISDWWPVDVQDGDLVLLVVQNTSDGEGSTPSLSLSHDLPFSEILSQEYYFGNQRLTVYSAIADGESVGNGTLILDGDVAANGLNVRYIVLRGHTSVESFTVETGVGDTPVGSLGANGTGIDIAIVGYGGSILSNNWREDTQDYASDFQIGVQWQSGGSTPPTWGLSYDLGGWVVATLRLNRG